jgi:hypothetical protein
LADSQPDRAEWGLDVPRLWARIGLKQPVDRNSAAAKEAEAGRALLNFLTMPATVAAFKTKGLEPVTQ